MGTGEATSEGCVCPEEGRSEHPEGQEEGLREPPSSPPAAPPSSRGGRNAGRSRGTPLCRALRYGHPADACGSPAQRGSRPVPEPVRVALPCPSPCRHRVVWREKGKTGAQHHQVAVVTQSRPPGRWEGAGRGPRQSQRRCLRGPRGTDPAGFYFGENPGMETGI